MGQIKKYGCRGPGFLKLNTSLLSETDYVIQIRKTIQETLGKHSEDETVNPSLLWETLKLKKPGEISSAFCQHKYKQNKHIQSKLEHDFA